MRFIWRDKKTSVKILPETARYNEYQALQEAALITNKAFGAFKNLVAGTRLLALENRYNFLTEKWR
jgi:hypothetical protein